MNSKKDARKRVILMIAIILISFVICWCPFHIEKLVEIVETSRTIDENVPEPGMSDPQSMCDNRTLNQIETPSHRVNGFTFKGKGSPSCITIMNESCFWKEN